MKFAPGRFEDPAGGPAVIALEGPFGDDFRMAKQLRYVTGDDPPLEFVFPIDVHMFKTDLSSVPRAIRWLFSRVGPELPAVLLHDALIIDEKSGESRQHEGPTVTRTEADLVFRNAMEALGVSVAQRYPMWAAVSVQTRWAASGLWKLLIAVQTLFVVAVNAAATIDVTTGSAVLPWMSGGTASDLLFGALLAVTIPFMLGLMWGGHRLVGTLYFVGLAFLLHATVIISVLLLAYNFADRAISRLVR